MNEGEINTAAAAESSNEGKGIVKGRGLWIAAAVVVILGTAVSAWLILQPFRGDVRSLLALLPPDADAYTVIDLDRLQSNPALKKLMADPPATSLSPEYQQLLSETGFRYQDDLKQVAAAKMGSDWVGAAIVEIEQPRLTEYLESQGALKSELDDHTVYSFGSERPFHLVLIDDRLVAFGVGGSLELLRDVVGRQSNRSTASALESLDQLGLLERFPDGSGLWLVAWMDRLLATNPEGPGLGPFQFGKDWWEGSKLVTASILASPLRLDIHLQNQCENAATAERMANALRAVLAILKAVPEGGSGGRNYGPLLAAIAIRQSDESVLLDWSWNPQMLALLTEESK
jgi:hypothetical protein